MTAKDLTVTAVSDMNLTVNLLQNLDMSYVIPEFKHGVTWKIPQYYKHAEVRRFLQELPYRFLDQVFLHKVEVFDKIDASGCCVYELTQHVTEGRIES